jgi:hypothetical protein
MRRTLLGAFVITAGLFLTAQSTSAHHSFSAKYDSNKSITLKGAVTKVEWANPHIYFYLDVKDDSGKVTNWAVEGATPNQLYRRGWKKDSLKIGDVVTVEAYGAKEEGLHHANGRSVVLADGRKVFSGSADGAPDGGGD